MITRKLHIRRLANFGADGATWLDGQVQAARDLFRDEAELDLQVSTNELRPFLEGVVPVNGCVMNGGNTPEQATLFNDVAALPAADLVAFIVRDFSPWQGLGCAWHPPARKGCMVKAGATADPKSWVWTLAHEIGHACGLSHKNFSTRLMYPSVQWTRDPPQLSEPEVNILLGGAAPAASGGSGALIEEADEEEMNGDVEKALAWELSKIEPNYRRLLKHGEKAVPLLTQFYEQAGEAEYKARAIYALSLVSQGLVSREFEKILTSAASSSNAQLRRAAASAAGRLRLGPVAERLLRQLREDKDASVRYVLEKAVATKE
jgi:hypothetical protein